MSDPKRMTIQDLCKEFALKSNQAHHDGKDVPPWIAIASDGENLAIHGNIRRPIDQLRLLCAGLRDLILMVGYEGEPLHLWELRGTPPEVREPRLRDIPYELRHTDQDASRTVQAMSQPKVLRPPPKSTQKPKKKRAKK